METRTGANTAAAPTVHLKRALGVWDLTWLAIVAVANMNVLPVIAANGPTTLWLWLGAFLFFFLPQALAVIELSHRYPQEGGVYLWTKEMFGDLHGFLAGWCYWTANIFYIPTLVFYLLGIATYASGPVLSKLGENSLAFGAFAIALLWLTAIANIRGLGVGKWVNNAGGIGTLVAAVLLILLGALLVMRGGIALPPGSLRLKGVDWSVVSSFGVICFALVGLELGCVMGDEIREPRRTVPKGVLYGGTLCAIQYLGATLALILAVPQREVKVVQGIVQAVDKMAARLGAGWILWPVAIFVAISTIGAISAWLTGSARILFVSGIDRYLPKIFANLHPKYTTPHIALIGIAIFSSCLIAMSFAGQSTVKEAYVTLLDLAVVVQMISYLYIYGSLARIAFGKTASQGFYGKVQTRFAALSGLCTTALGLIVAFVPSHQVDSVWRFELKMFASCITFLGLAIGLFFYYSRRKVELVSRRTAQV